MKDQPLNIFEHQSSPKLAPLNFSGTTYPFTNTDTPNMAFVNRGDGVTACGYNGPAFSCQNWNLMEEGTWQDSGAGDGCYDFVCFKSILS